MFDAGHLSWKALSKSLHSQSALSTLFLESPMFGETPWLGLPSLEEPTSTLALSGLLFTSQPLGPHWWPISNSNKLKPVGGSHVKHRLECLTKAPPCWLPVSPLYQSSLVAITTNHKLGSLSIKHLFLHSSGGWKCGIKEWGEVGSLEPFSLVFTWPCCFLSLGDFSSVHAHSGCLSVFLEVHQSYWVRTSFNPNYLLKTPSPNIVTLGFRALTYDFRGDNNAASFV